VRLTWFSEAAVKQWGSALLITLVINLALFWLLTRLTGQTVPPSDMSTSAVQMVHVTPPPPPQQVAAQQQQPKTQPRRKIAQPTPATMTPPSLTLQLELIPDVPTTLGDIAMPEVQLAAVAPLPSIFDSDALDQPLTPLSQSPFIYPLRAKRLGIEGWVKVKLLISTSGDVEQVHILEAQPQEMFESTVERGIRRWRFTPGTVQGEPVRSWVITTIRFELES